jgi:hypothetical protein
MTVISRRGNIWSYVAVCALLLQVTGHTAFDGDDSDEDDEVLENYFKIRECSENSDVKEKDKQRGAHAS